MEKKRIIVAGTGASGFPILEEVLRLLRRDGRMEIHLILSDSARLTLEFETGHPAAETETMADVVYRPDEIGAAPAGGTFRTEGMLIVPCSMKTAAGIHSGYADNLILRAADVTIKENRPLVLAARESPLSAIHLRNLYELSLVPGVRIIPPVMSFYFRPDSVGDMVRHAAARLVEPFGVKSGDCAEWEGLP